MAFNRLMLSALLVCVAALFGQSECLRLDITPSKTSVNPGEDVVMRFDVTSCLEASKINSLELHEEKNSLANVTLTTGTNGTTQHTISDEMTKRIKVEGLIDNDNTTSSYMSVTFTKPSVMRTGTYVATVTYTDKDSAVRTVSTTYALVVEGTSACPSDWVFYNGMCYRLHPDSVSQDNFYWLARECRIKYKGSLVRIENEDINEFLQHDFPWKSNAGGIWIGLHDKVEGSFTWNFDTRNATYFNWASEDKTGSLGDYCVAFFPSTGKWREVTCTGYRYFMCQSTPSDLAYKEKNPFDDEDIFSK